MEKPLGEIEDIYKTPLLENQATSNYNFDSELVQKIQGFKQVLTQDINRLRKKLGVENISPINLQKDKADELRQAIKADSKWQKHYYNLISVLEPDLDLQDSHKELHLPWWNELVLNFDSDIYNSGKLKTNFKQSHSYIDQLGRENIVELQPHLLSIAGVLTTIDEVLVLGLRGGQSFGKTYMAVPAGSINAHTGKNPLFETADAELLEETGLKREDLTDFGLIGRGTDFSLQGGDPRSYYVFNIKTNKSYHELLETWKNSIDRNEHSYLGVFPNDASKMLERIKSMGYDFSNVGGNLQKTIPLNYGAILPPSAISVLTHYTQQKGKDWAKYAEQELDGHYDLTSCFKK